MTNLNRPNSGKKLIDEVTLRAGLTEQYWSKQQQLNQYKLKQQLPKTKPL